MNKHCLKVQSRLFSDCTFIFCRLYHDTLRDFVKSYIIIADYDCRMINEYEIEVPMMMLNGEEVYILPYEKEADKRLLYSPIRGFVELIDQKDAFAIENSINNCKINIQHIGSIDQLMEAMIETPVKDLNMFQNGFPSLNIDLTTGCNLRCVYCYAGRGAACVTYQKEENIDQIIATYFQYLHQQPEYHSNSVCPIVFSNDAEPTYSPELLQYTVSRIKEKASEYYLKPQFYMPTNGAFRHDLCNFIIDHFYGVSISFDGLEKIQNQQRPYVNGSPSYERVYRNAKSLYNSNLKIGFNIVVTANNLDNMRETVDYFDQHFPGAAISFSPVNLSGRALIEKAELMIDYTEYQSKLMECLDYAQTTTIRVNDKNYWSYHHPRRHYCSSTAKPNWNVNLEGEIFACMESKEEAMRIGRIDFNSGELSLDDKHIQSLRTYTVDQKCNCRDCFAKYLCVGGCKIRALSQGKECDRIRLKCVRLINHAYEEEQMFKTGQALFRIN